MIWILWRGRYSGPRCCHAVPAPRNAWQLPAGIPSTRARQEHEYPLSCDVVAPLCAGLRSENRTSRQMHCSYKLCRMSWVLQPFFHGWQNGCHGPKRSYRRMWKPGMRIRRLAFFVDNVVYRNENALFCEEHFKEDHVSYVHFTYKDVDSFRHGSVHELYSSKA